MTNYPITMVGVDIVDGAASFANTDHEGMLEKSELEDRIQGKGWRAAGTSA